MAKDRLSRLTDFADYVAVRSAVLLVQLMPLSWSRTAARMGAWLAYRLNRRHRLVTAGDLRHRFPQHSEAQIDGLVRASYLHLFTAVIETAIMLRRMRRDNVSDHVREADPEDGRLARELMTSDRPTIVMTGPVGNGEALSLALGASGADLSVEARRSGNPHLDRWLWKVRRSGGVRTVWKERAAEAVLQRGGNLVVPASTSGAIARLSLRHQAPILVLSCLRTGGPLRYELSLEDVILPEDYEHNPNAARAVTQRCAAAQERLARRHPEQCLWLHPRAEHPSTVGAGKKAA